MGRSSHLKISKDKLELTGFFLILISIIFPLELDLFGGLVKVVTWHIPFFSLLLLIFLKGLMLNKLQIRRFDYWDGSLLFFGITLTLSTLLGANLPVNFHNLLNLLIGLLLAVFIRYNYNKIYTLKIIIYFFLIMLFFEAFTGIIQQATNSTFGNPSRMLGAQTKDTIGHGVEVSRILGTLGHPNWVATWCLIALPFAYISTGLFRSKLYWYANRVIILLTLVTVLFTVSRAVLVILMLFSITFLVAGRVFNVKISYRFSPGHLLFYSVILFFISAFVVVYSDLIFIMLDFLQYRIDQTVAGGSGESVDYRLLMNKGAFRIFSENPIFGVGYTNVRLMWEDLGFFSIRDEMRPHNVYLSILAGGGFLSFIFFIYAFFFPLVRLLKNLPFKGLTIAFLWGMIAYPLLFLVYISPLTYQNIPFLFLFYGFSMGYMDNYLNNVKKNKELSE